MRQKYLYLIWLGILSFTISMASTAVGGEIQYISAHDLNSILAQSDIVVLDVRTSGDWHQSDKKIKRAIRQDPQNVKMWMHQYPSNQKLVFYCD